jgi:uncharacterized membrane protein
MNRRLFAASALSTAVGLALAVQAAPVQAQQMSPMAQKMLNATLKAHPGANKAVVERNMAYAMKYHLQKCYGINAAYKNDCASGVHSCAGQASIARDPNSFVLLPAGDCAKIAGGSLKPA